MSRATGDDDAPLTQALDSFDQLSLRRDRERRRVTEEENAVRCLEELVTEKQREAQQLAREADSRAAELAALERRVPALEDTHRGARRSLQMLTEMRDLLRKQLAAEKRTTEEMLQKLDEQMQEAEARWTQYEFVYLTMPHYQRKLEADALAGEERELTERRRQLEATLSARVSDRDFVVRLAECCWQARLLEGGRGGRGAGGGGDVSPERENMSGACSQGFGTPRASRTPSPVCDMETGDEPDSGESRADSPAQDSREPKRPAYSPQHLPTPIMAGGDQARYRGVGGAGERSSPSRGAGGTQGAPQRAQPPPLPFSQSQVTPARQSPTVSAKPSLYDQRSTSVADLKQRPAVPQCRVGLWPPQQAAASSQSPTSAAAQPAETATAPRSKPSPEKPQWDSEPAPSPRRQGSFMIQMPTLYRPSWPRAGATAEASSDRRPAVPASPARTVAAPPIAPPTPPSPRRETPTSLQRQQMPSILSPQRRPQAPPTSASMAQDVEMTDLQEVPPSPSRARADAASGRRGSDEQASPRDSSPSESPPVRRAATAAERQSRPPVVSAAQETAVSSPSAAAATGQGTPAGPSPPRALVSGRQYWLPLPPETPVAPPADERRSFVQQLRKSPELGRRPPPPAGRQTATPLEPGLEHRFLRPAVPTPHRPGTATSNAQSIFDTPRRPPVEPASPQRPAVSSPSSTPARLAPPSTPRAAPPPEAAPEPATPIRPPAAAGDAPRSAAAFFQSPEVDAGQLDASFSLFGGPPAKGASPQPPQPSSMSLFGAGDVGGDGDQGADDFSFSFFGGGSRETEKEAASGGGGMFSFF